MNIESNKFDELTFPISVEEAKKRFEQFEHIDPLLNVDPALLNSGDIYDYARITGMIWPFEIDKDKLKKKLKPASYEIDFLGDIRFFDEHGKLQFKSIEEGIPFTLPKNSIVYVFLATKFHLPDYIALRFNLKITHVHRGLLLGTGPLIDPGFTGQLLIPLHNLTSEDYQLKGGDGLIWVEFTKISRHNHWDNRGRHGAYEYVHFNNNKRKRGESAERYFNNATNGKPAASSIPGTLERSQKAIDKIDKLQWGGILTAAITIFVFCIGMLLPTWQLISDARTNLDLSTNKIVSEDKQNLEILKKRVDTLEAQIKKMEDQSASLSKNKKQPLNTR